MPFFPFKTRRTFTTSLSKEEAIRVVQQMLSSRSKFLFFSIPRHFGSVHGGQFALSTNVYQARLLYPVVKGQLRDDHPTLVDLNFHIPIIPAFFLLVFPLIFIPLFFTLDEMTINGVVREPTMNERIGFALLFIGVPAWLYYWNFIRPLKKLYRVLKNKLRLEERG